ncbi:MAG: MG2 domain-containing protein [bacterium]
MLRDIRLALVLLTALAAGCDQDAPAPADAPASAPPAAAGSVASDSPAAASLLIDPAAPQAGAGEAAPPEPQVQAASAATPLAVAVAVPRGKVEGVVRPTITFNKPVHALGTTRVEGPLADISPPLPGEWKWLGTATLEFVPSRPPPLSTAFEVRVQAGLKALDGTRLTEDYRFSFETPRIQPIDGEPVSSWRAHPWVRPDQSFMVRFDQRPTEASLREAIRLRSADGEVGVSVISIRTVTERLATEGKPAPMPTESGSDRRVEVTFTPERPLAADTDYTLVFTAGLQSAEGALPTDKEHRWPFRTYGPLRIKSTECPKWLKPCALGPLQVEFSNPVSAAELKRGLRLEPAIELEWPEDLTVTRNEWRLSGAFKPASTYRVMISGVKDEFGQAQVSPYDGSFITGDMDARFDMTDGRLIVERGHRLALPMSHVNVDGIEIGWVRLTPAEALPWLLEPWRNEEPPGISWGYRQLAGHPNQVTRTPLDLNALLAGPGDGRIALVRTRRQVEKYTEKHSALAQVTDLGLHGKISPNDVTLWVWKLSDGRPAATAAVELLDKTGRVLATAAADDDGVAHLPGVDALDLPKVDPWGNRLWDPPPVVARVRLGDDVVLAALESDWSLSPYRFGLDSAWENSAPQAEGLVFTDRGIYRPGEKVYLKGALRERVLGKLRTPAGRTVTLKVVDPKGQTIATSTQTLSRFGGFAAEVELPAGVVGTYSFAITDDPRSLRVGVAQVAEYRAPAFLVDVTPAPGARYAGQRPAPRWRAATSSAPPCPGRGGVVAFVAPRRLRARRSPGPRPPPDSGMTRVLAASSWPTARGRSTPTASSPSRAALPRPTPIAPASTASRPPSPTWIASRWPAPPT